MKKTLIASAVAMGLGVPAAHAVQFNPGLVPDGFVLYSDSANFTMLATDGTMSGGTNDVKMTWDGTVFTDSTDYTGPGSTSNLTASSTTPFQSNVWTAHDIQVFGTGTYTFDVSLGGGAETTGSLSMTVPTGHLGVHMLFDWGSNANIDVAVVGVQNSVYGVGVGYQADAIGADRCGVFVTPTIINCLYDGINYGTDGKPAGDTIWGLATVDGDADSIMGIPMPAGGPFEFFNAGFNANLAPVAIPVPAAVWLFGSGLLGLVGVARRKKQA